MAILFSPDIDDGLRVEGFEPRIIKRYVHNELEGLELNPYEYYNHRFFYNGRECSVWAEGRNNYIFVEHIIFNIFRAK